MPGFLLKAKNILGTAAKNYAKNKVTEKAVQTATNNGETSITNLAGKVVIICVSTMFIFMALFLQLADASNIDSIFGAVGGFQSSDSSSGGGSGTITSSTEVGNTVINCALEQKGKPYIWGAEGPDSYDCSGLVKYCYEKAGISLAHQTESIMKTAHNSSEWQVSNLSDDYRAYPGDILWRSGHAGLVKEVDSNGTIISYVHAPTFGAVVRDTDSLSWSNFTEVFHYVG